MDDTLRQLLTIGKEHYLKRDFPGARAYLEQVVERSQSFADVYNMLGVIYHDMGQFSKAQGALEQALALNPAYTEAALNLAVLYNDLGKYAEAKEIYRRALLHSRGGGHDIDPFVAGKLANMHAEIADAYCSAGYPERAVEEYEKAVELRPTFSDIRTRFAAALRDAGRLDEAVAQLTRALDDRPQYLPARILLGVCYFSMGRTEEAVGQWTQVLAQEPGNPRAAMYLKLVRGDDSAH